MWGYALLAVLFLTLPMIACYLAPEFFVPKRVMVFVVTLSTAFFVVGLCMLLLYITDRQTGRTGQLPIQRARQRRHAAEALARITGGDIPRPVIPRIFSDTSTNYSAVNQEPWDFIPRTHVFQVLLPGSEPSITAVTPCATSTASSDYNFDAPPNYELAVYQHANMKKEDSTTEDPPPSYDSVVTSSSL